VDLQGWVEVIVFSSWVALASLQALASRPYYHLQFLFVNSCLHCLILQEIRIVLGNPLLSNLS
jgi:hypothetical protein